MIQIRRLEQIVRGHSAVIVFCWIALALLRQDNHYVHQARGLECDIFGSHRSCKSFLLRPRNDTITILDDSAVPRGLEVFEDRYLDECKGDQDNSLHLGPAASSNQLPVFHSMCWPKRSWIINVASVASLSKRFHYLGQYGS